MSDQPLRQDAVDRTPSIPLKLTTKVAHRPFIAERPIDQQAKRGKR
jgi:hypothetical protein